MAGGPWIRSRPACALRMSRREMLGERQVAAPLMARRAAHGALRLAHRRFQPGQGVGIQLAGLRLSGKPQRPSQCQFGHQTLVLTFALFAPAASRPGQHRAVRRQRGRQVAPCCHTSTVGQRFPRLVLRDDSRSGAEHPVLDLCPAWRNSSLRARTLLTRHSSHQNLGWDGNRMAAKVPCSLLTLACQVLPAPRSQHNVLPCPPSRHSSGSPRTTDDQGIQVTSQPGQVIRLPTLGTPR